MPKFRYTKKRKTEAQRTAAMHRDRKLTEAMIRVLPIMRNEEKIRRVKRSLAVMYKYDKELAVQADIDRVVKEQWERMRRYSVQTRGQSPLDKKPRERLFDSWSGAVYWVFHNDPLESVKLLDKIIAEEVIDEIFDRGAWYYDRSRVREYVIKNIPVKRGQPFYKQDIYDVSTGYLKLFAHYPSFRYAIASLYVGAVLALGLFAQY